MIKYQKSSSFESEFVLGCDKVPQNVTFKTIFFCNEIQLLYDYRIIEFNHSNPVKTKQNAYSKIANF